MVELSAVLLIIRNKVPSGWFDVTFFGIEICSRVKRPLRVKIYKGLSAATSNSIILDDIPPNQVHDGRKDDTESFLIKC